MKKKKLYARTAEYILNRSPSEILTLKVQDIAEFLNVSTPHLSRTFKKEMGVSLKKFITNERIVIMRSLLVRNMDVSINDIARHFAFCSSDYFIKIFKEHTGMTPDRFRRSCKGFSGMEERRKYRSDKRSSVKMASTDRRGAVKDRRKIF